MTTDLDPLVPRPIDQPTTLPLDGDIDAEIADRAKIFAAPDDPADWPAWRAQLQRWRADAVGRFGEIQYPVATDWASRCFTVAIVWLWDERLFDPEAQRFTPERFFDDDRGRSAVSTGSCCGMPIRSSASTSATSSTTTGTFRASTTLVGAPASPWTAGVHRLQPVGRRHPTGSGRATRRCSHRSSPTSVSTACSSTRCARAATSSSRRCADSTHRPSSKANRGCRWSASPTTS